MKISPPALSPVVVLAIVALASLSPVLAAQQESAFAERVDVSRVNVEVWVTDRQGNSITGLTAEDFEVREDGQAVEIANFYEVRDPAPETPRQTVGAAPAAIEADGRGLAGPADQNEPIEAARAADAGWLAFYFDELFSEPAGRAQLVEDLRVLLARELVPAERILILRQNVGLEVEVNIGSTQAEVKAALDRLETPSTRGVQTWADERNVLRTLQQEWERENVINASGNRDPCDFFPRKANSLIQDHINTSRVRIGETLGYLETSVGILAGLPGPKTMIYAADGLPLAPGTDLISFVKSLCQGSQDDRRLDYLDGMGDSFRRLSRHANASRVTIYAIQALGLRSNLSATSAETRGVNGTLQALSRYNSESRLQQRQGMTYLAEQTGGRTVFNRNDFVGELRQIASDMSGYYSLAYAPTHGGDGLEHKIDVKVRGAKLRVRHRPGYRDKSTEQRLVEQLQSAIYLNLVNNPMAVRLAAGDIKRGKKDQLKLPLFVRVPVDAVVFLPQSGGNFASLEVAVMTRNDGGAKTSFKRERYRLARPAQEAEGLTLSLAIDLDLEPGVHVIAFAVRDLATEIVSVVATAVDLQPPSPARARTKLP